MNLLNKILKTDDDKATILIRFIVGYVFIMEGIQKFVYSDKLGVGRFTKIGIPQPEILAPFVGVCEIVFGFFILIGFLTRLATIPQMIIMLTALATTKISILMEKGILTFSHDSRNDLLMLFGLLFLLCKGAGANSVDQKLIGRC
ncbi:MAG: DoxX family protein [Bacteriovoracaceae bacterium]